MRRREDKRLDGGRRQLIFEHEWREDFIGEALTLEVDATGRVQMFELYSADHGVVRWAAGSGLGNARRWESEAETQNRASDPHGRHYIAPMLDGATTDAGTLQIIDAVSRHLQGTSLGTLVRAALSHPQLPHVIDQSIEELFVEPEQDDVAPPESSAGAGIGGRFKRALRDVFSA